MVSIRLVVLILPFLLTTPAAAFQIGDGFPAPQWIYRGDHCGGPDPAVATLAEAYQGEKGFELPRGIPEEEVSSFGPGPVYIAVSLGTHQTGGYRPVLAQDDLFRDQGDLVVEVATAGPPAGADTPQVITHPCGVLKFTGGIQAESTLRVRMGSSDWLIRFR